METSSPSRMLASLPDLYYNQGLALARKGALAGARDRLLAALALEPEMVDAHVVLGKVYAQLGELPPAIASWEAALALDPESAAARAGIAEARAAQARLAGARQRRRLLLAGVGCALFALGVASTWTYGAVLAPGRPGAVSTVVAAAPSATVVAAIVQPTPRPADTPRPEPTSTPVAASRPTPTPRPAPPLDAVRQALRSSPGLAGAQVEASAEGETIVLKGAVDGEVQRELARAVAESKAGGARVDASGVTVRGSTRAADSLRRLLEALGDAELSGVTVAQSGSALRLSGAVPADAAKRRAEALAAAVAADAAGGVTVDASALVSQGTQDYVVRAGDTLWQLAERFYGNGREWPAIAAANPELPRDFAQLPVGARLKIPPRRPAR